ncbi:Equilibrative nucleoside transporter 1 [Orchesella cincta]|uniref:Equilibrative nucleoside transporter 1 n=1 Tax=Orchesella cincta TaxID=48709 RepID=A0A1D2N3U1_ORCCI|nr:Equilibrative nucleoside transporter 1 [Orchesella cincta]
MAGEKRAPLASIDDFSSICYYSPGRPKKLSDFSMPLLRKGEQDGGIELMENSENVENIAKYNVNKKLRPLVKVPQDRFNLVYLILVIHGVGTLMPWNMFITAKDYFVSYKLSEKYTGQQSEYAANFLQYIGFAAQIPNVFFNWFNIFIQIGGSLKTRIVWSIVIEVILFIFTVVLAMLDTSEYPGVFFWLTIASVVVINMAGGIYQNSVYGIAAKLDYTGAVVLGSNISGTFTSIINLISLAMAPSERTAAIYYFITALFVLLTCFDTYFALPLTKFYRYHEMMSAREQENKRQAGRRGVSQRTPYFAILKKCFPQCFNVFMVFFVTLAIFPAVHSDVKMVNPDFVIPDKYFVGVTCFLTFNLFAMLGNMVPGLFQWPGPKYLWVPVMLRILFIPFFLLCNYQPKDITRVFMPNFAFDDWTYWSGGVLLGLTSGYYSSLAMMYCPRCVETEYAPIAGMFGAAFLITGIFAGINFSLLMPILVSKVAIG